MTLEFQHRVADIDHAKDGDSYVFSVRIAPGCTPQEATFQVLYGRLLGWDCPESRKPASAYEIAKSVEALDLAYAFLIGPGDLWCRRELKRDPYDRELVTLWHVIDGIETDLGETLADAGLATRWPQKWRDGYPEPA